MGLKDRISKGIIVRPALVVLYGPDGCGKTTWASTSPKAIFIGPEKGSDGIDVERLSPKNFGELIADLNDVLNDETHSYKSLVIDSLDWIEPMLWDHVCRQNKWENIEEPGFGKGYAIALSEWRKMMATIDQIRDRRSMNVILIAHSQMKTFNDPRQALPYDRFSLKLNEKASALWREFVDAVLFVDFETLIAKSKTSTSKGKAVGDGKKRVIYTSRAPAHDAKNRFGLPDEMELTTFADFAAACKTPVKRTIEETKQKILDLLPQVKDSVMVEKIVKNCKDAENDQPKLESYVKRIEEIIETQSL